MLVIAFLLLVIGGLNWLLLGVFQWEIGALFGGQGESISRIIYVLIGLAAIYEVVQPTRRTTKRARKEQLQV